MSEPEDPAAHETSLAVWDVTSPVVAGHRATLKVGLACSSGCACDLTGTRIDVYNQTGTRVGGGRLGSVPWPATTALYWADVEVAAPEAEGEQSWSVQATAQDSSHGPATSMVRVIAVRPPEHRVTLKAIHKGTAVPLAGVQLRVGVFRAATNEAGIAQIEVPGGTYDVVAWERGFDILSRSVNVAADVSLQLELAATTDPDPPYWM